MYMYWSYLSAYKLFYTCTHTHTFKQQINMDTHMHASAPTRARAHTHTHTHTHTAYVIEMHINNRKSPSHRKDTQNMQNIQC